MKTYYSLAVQWEKGDRFTPEFGDYDFEVVNDEREDMIYSYNLKGKQVRIIKTQDSQSAIEQAIAKLNSTLKGIQ